MKNKKIDIEKITRELIQKGEVQQPGADFTKNLMGRILKNPNVTVQFIKQEKDKNFIWVLFSLALVFIGYIAFFVYKNGLNSIAQAEKIHAISYLKSVFDFFTKLWSEFSFSPYILIAFLGIIILILFDKFIVKYLYSI
ncbi:MAG: hypothetical protein A2X13_13705 [Bacteroidetes bacterium GWC2_33_15]|nr:MAG: hypothetical protein A2X10_08920 [Bacteroidetes bacterium GWA2_33_15]OFX50403.1 MAG: hypothetical protein A2X13_13705 [Bacteroidetes bacterium GWC2_33_15]OFX66679.1 MAG: hypothetical protein A2X15_08170 [Bacteroidetes bacterium GWB2_32_14]OFX69297.1 MAG: hypothetical protein A2X14_09100 [Bacteroidetes bacterium GWD2_33_33]HAN18613.1 hypothetical protein [Bacteroidales bacterium]